MRSSLLRVSLVLAALLIPAAGAQAADCPGADLVPDASNVAQVADATLCLINEQRAAAGLRPVSADAQLSAASTDYAADMIARGFFAHESPDGGTLEQRLAKVGYGFELAGENIAWGESVLGTPAQIVKAWMHSEGHRANILERGYRQIGLGIVPGLPRASSIGGATYVTDFGTPEVAVEPVARVASKTPALAAHAKRAARPIAHYSLVRRHHRRAHRRHARHTRHHTHHARHQAPHSAA